MWARRLVPALAVAAAAFGAVGVAQAGDQAFRTQASSTANLGAPTSIRVVLRSPKDDSPVANTPLVFHTDATFARVTDEVEIGRAVTNADGVAVMTFEPHVAGDHEVRVDFEDVGKKVNLAKVIVSVSGDQQLVRSTAGIHIHGLNVWLLIGLIAAIWSILLSVAIRVIAIARASDPVELERRSGSARTRAPGPLPTDGGGES